MFPTLRLVAVSAALLAAARPAAAQQDFRHSLVASNGADFSDTLTIATGFECDARKVGGRLRCGADPAPETMNLPLILGWHAHPKAKAYTVLAFKGREQMERTETTDTTFSTTLSQTPSGAPGVVNRTQYRYRVLARSRPGAPPLDSTNVATVRVVWSIR